jgi:hypothetical protein
MNTATNNPLEQLADIHLPEQISQLPLAPGWWLLAIALIGITFLASYKLIRYRQLSRFKRQALKQLASEQLSTEQSLTILKAACLAYYPREQVAKLHSEQLLTFLSEQLNAKYQQEFTTMAKPALTRLYQKTAAQDNQLAEELQQAVIFWINKALPVNNKVQGGKL